MQKINRRIRILFSFALGLSIGFPVGVLCIIFGAIYGMVALLVVGIALAVAGFYAMPLLWVRYGERRRDRTLLLMIKKERIYTVSGLAAQTGYPENLVREKLKKALLSRELEGYLLVDDALELNVNAEQVAKPRLTRKCDNCGAAAPFDGVKFVCEYCGGVANREQSPRASE